MLGTPPNCRPECIIHQECPSNRACMNQKCQDPCIGTCGFNAKCTTQNHQPICSCIEGYEGDPYASCTPRQSKYKCSLLFSHIYIYLLIACTYFICQRIRKTIDSTVLPTFILTFLAIFRNCIYF